MRRKLLIIYVILVFLPIAMVGYSYYRYATRSASNEINQAVLQTLTQTKYNVENTLDGIEQESEKLFFNPEVKAFVGPQNNSDLILQLKQLEQLRSQFYTLQRDNKIFKVRMYVDGRKMASSERVNFFPLKDIQNEPWYAATVKQQGASVWSETYVEKGIAGTSPTALISCRRVLKHSDMFQDNDGILSVDMAESSLYQLLSDIELRQSEQLFIVDRQGKLISGKDKASLGARKIENLVLEKLYREEKGILAPSETDSEDYLVFTTIKNTDWKLVDTISQDHLLETSGFWNDIWVVAMLIVVIAVFTSASFIVVNNIIKEFQKRVNSVAGDIEREEVRLSHDKPGPAGKRSDEMDKVESLVYALIQRSNRLVEETYEARIEERKAQLQALQAQINPHFLYNTLDCINWMAVRQEAPDISVMVTNLAKYFRLTLNKGNSIVTIRDEIELAKTYLTIQNKRFDNAVQTVLDVDPETESYKIPKLTLQPVVENAVVHGVMKKPGNSGSIRISTKLLEDEIFIVVEDDGVGMDGAMVEELLSRERSGHYGLYNVNARIKLYFGEGFGVAIESEPGKGTKVTLRVGKM